MTDKKTVNKVLDLFLKSGNGAISLLSGLLSAFLILYSAYVLYDINYTNNKAFTSSWELAQYKPVIIEDPLTPLAGGENLKEINEDYRAWVTVYETPIDYPILQGKDDLYYAAHDIYGNTSLTGAIYLATGNTSDFSDRYNLLYGHHMDNGAMFGSLDLYRDEAFFNSNTEGILVTQEKVYDLKVLAVIQTDAYENKIYIVGPNKNIGSFRDYVNNNHLHINSDAFNSADQYLAMSTCSGGLTSSRLVVIWQMTEKAMIPEDDPNTHPIIDDKVPTDSGKPHSLIDIFFPSGQVYGENCWALVNLICLIVCFYILLPLRNIPAKYKRDDKMEDLLEEKLALFEADAELSLEEKQEKEQIENYIRQKDTNAEVNEETIEEAVTALFYKKDKFSKKKKTGIIAQIILVILALILFIITENMKTPMVLIDKWTPVMLLITAVVLLIDIVLIRYREKKQEKENKDE